MVKKHIFFFASFIIINILFAYLEDQNLLLLFPKDLRILHHENIDQQSLHFCTGQKKVYILSM